MSIKKLLLPLLAVAVLLIGCHEAEHPVGPPPAALLGLWGAPLEPPSFTPTGAPPVIKRTFGLTPFAARIEWTPPEGAAGFEVYRGPQASGPWWKVTAQPILGGACTLASENPSNKCFTDQPLAPGLTLFYMVAAKYSDKRDGLSQSMSATTPLAHPSNFSAREIEPVGSGTIELTWTPITHAQRYWIGGPSANVFLAGFEGTHTIQGLLPDTYTYTLLTYYDVPGIGEVEVFQNAPQANVTVQSARICMDNGTGIPGEAIVLRAPSDDWKFPKNAAFFRHDDIIFFSWRDGPFGTDQVELELVISDHTDWAKQLQAWNTCSNTRIATIEQTVKDGPPVTMRVRRGPGQTDLVVLRKPKFLGIWTDVYHLDPDTFWRFFGGKILTIDWKADAHRAP